MVSLGTAEQASSLMVPPLKVAVAVLSVPVPVSLPWMRSRDSVEMADPATVNWTVTV